MLKGILIIVAIILVYNKINEGKPRKNKKGYYIFRRRKGNLSVTRYISTPLNHEEVKEYVINMIEKDGFLYRKNEISESEIKGNLIINEIFLFTNGREEIILSTTSIKRSIQIIRYKIGEYNDNLAGIIGNKINGDIKKYL